MKPSTKQTIKNQACADIARIINKYYNRICKDQIVAHMRAFLATNYLALSDNAQNAIITVASTHI